MTNTMMIVMLVACLAITCPLGAATLTVGPKGTYAKVADALKAAKDGDVIEVDTKGTYEKDVSYVRASNLTIRGVGEGRAVLDAKGTIAGRKGIFVTTGKNITVENIEFCNAGGEVNAAGIRAEGENLTVRNCKFFECRDALLGGAGEVLIEHSEFSHCGHNDTPATHNLYISQRVTKLTYRYNYSHYTYEGHLLKSRAKENWILYNRLTDEDGQGSAVADFPDGGLVVMVGNVLHKGPHGSNNRLIAFGMEGLKHERNEVYVVNNSMWWDNRRPNDAWFVRVETRAAKPKTGEAPDPANKDVKVAIRNNVCVGPLALTNAPKFEESGNLIFKTVAEAGFVDGAKFDFHLKAGSPCIDKGVAAGKFVLGASMGSAPEIPGAVDAIPEPADFDLTPKLEYVHPQDSRKRPDDGKLDIGAFEFVAPAK